jgi:hypothetical protein
MTTKEEIKRRLQFVVDAPNDIPEGAFASAQMMTESVLADALLYIIKRLEEIENES